MPDIRAILENLDDDARRDYQDWRSQIRSVYLTAHTHLVGSKNWRPEDDAFLDLVDIRLAVLFDRAGALVLDKPAGFSKEAEPIINDLMKQDSKITAKIDNVKLNRDEIRMFELMERMRLMNEAIAKVEVPAATTGVEVAQKYTNAQNTLNQLADIGNGRATNGDWGK